MDLINWLIRAYSKNLCTRTLNFEGHVTVGSYFNDYKFKYQAVRFLIIYETVNLKFVHCTLNKLILTFVSGATLSHFTCMRGQTEQASYFR